MIIEYNGRQYNLQTRNPTQVREFCSETGLSAFPETTGNFNVVFYDPEQYTVMQTSKEKRDLVYIGNKAKPTQPINMSSMHNMFTHCVCKDLDLSHWDTQAISDMSYVFAGSIRTVDLTGWDYSSCQTIEGMFANCLYLSTVDIEIPDYANIFDMSNMFYNCTSLRKAVVNIKCSGLEYAEGVFDNCTSMTDCSLINLKTDYIEDIGFMFYNCVSLCNLDISGWSYYSFKSMGHLFTNCRSLAEFDFTIFDRKGFGRKSLDGYLDGCDLLLQSINDPKNVHLHGVRNWVYAASVFDSCDLDSYIDTVYSKHYSKVFKDSLASLWKRYPDKFELAAYLSSTL